MTASAIFVVGGTCLGLAAGWAADRIGDNCEAYLEEGLRAVFRRGYCSRCGAVPPWWLHLPIVGVLNAHGRCPQCGLKLEGDRRLLEVLGALSFGLAAVVLGPGIQALVTFAALALLLGCVATDLYASVIPQELTTFALWLGLLAAVYGCSAVTPSDGIVGAALGWGGLKFVQSWGLWTRGSVSMGDGDLNLLAVGGAWGGVVGVGYGLMIGAALVLAHTIVNHARGAKAEADKPFGPFLAIGIWLVMLSPNPLELLRLG